MNTTYPEWGSAEDFDGLEDFYSACAIAEEIEAKEGL